MDIDVERMERAKCFLFAVIGFVIGFFVLLEIVAAIEVWEVNP